MAKMTVYNNVAGLNRALRKLPKEATAELRHASVDIAQAVAQEAADTARGEGGVASLVAPTIRATRDRVPVVKMGGATRLPERYGHARTGKR